MAIENTIKAAASDLVPEISTKTLYEKVLPDGRSHLKLIEVVNKTIAPGKIYQVEFTDGALMIPFPRYCEKYAEDEIKKLYGPIRSRADIEKFMREEEQEFCKNKIVTHH